MRNLETFTSETQDCTLLDEFVLSTEQWHDFEPGSLAYRVQTYNGNGNLVGREYVLRGMKNTNEVLQDLQNVAEGYYFETVKVSHK